MSTLENLPLEIKCLILQSLDTRNSLRRATIASRELMVAYLSDKKRILRECPVSPGYEPERSLGLAKAWCEGKILSVWFFEGVYGD